MPESSGGKTNCKGWETVVRCSLKKPQDDGKYREVRGIRLCPENECPLEPRDPRCYERDPELWQGYRRLLRDVVGALNIATVAGLVNAERPGMLCRNSQ